jgi:hypothetical protein
LAAYEAVCAQFGNVADKDAKTTAETLLLKAQTTVAQAILLEALQMHSTDFEGGQELIQSVVKRFPKAKILPSKHLHKGIWKFSQCMIKGEMQWFHDG